MVQSEIKTGVDDLLAYVEKKDKVSLKDAATDLKISQDTLQLWVDFLVEERILGMEYKFTKPYIYLNQKTKKKTFEQKEQSLTLHDYKQDFIKHAKEKNLPENKIEIFWQQHLERAIEQNKQYFMREAAKYGFKDSDSLFHDYLNNRLAKTLKS